MTQMLFGRQGQTVDLARPLAGQAAITIENVAHALANINRYNGHGEGTISVLQHSLLVAKICKSYSPDAPVNHAMLEHQGLLHDAHEALIGDTTSPVKAMLREFDKGAFDALDRRMAFEMGQVLGCPVPISPAVREAIHRADMLALLAEVNYLFGDIGEWHQWECVQPYLKFYYANFGMLLAALLTLTHCRPKILIDQFVNTNWRLAEETQIAGRALIPAAAA